MRWLIALVLVASLAVGLALAMRYNAGYVLFMVPPYRVELSVSLFVLLVAIVIGFAYFSLRVVFRAIQLPERARQFRQGRRRAQAHAAMLDGLRAMFEGRYAHAVRAAGKAANLGEAPVLNALIAARSAHLLREFELRDEWL